MSMLLAKQRLVQLLWEKNWEQALSANKPCVLNVKCDPEVPPLPPHITFTEAKAFMTSAVQGDPDEGRMIKGSIKQVLSSVFAED